MDSEESYIAYRRRKAAGLARRFHFLRTLPIQQNKIVFAAFEGDGGFCCNPRYIAEALYRSGEQYEMVWLLHDTGKSFPSYIAPVEDTPWNVAYHLSTAKVWVDNYRKPLGTQKRRGQLYLQTWHASMGFKAVGEYRGALFPRIARIVSEADSRWIDCCISNSDYCTSIYPKKLLYDGPVLQVGSPRCDILIKERETWGKEIRSRYGIPQEQKIVLYAPTFRGGTERCEKHAVGQDMTLDVERVAFCLQQRFGGSWRVFLRLHPQVAAKLHGTSKELTGKEFLDVSSHDDMSELLAAADALITDYSSCAFDAAFAGIPVFLYAEDIHAYREKRGKFMWKREELPFPLAENNDGLMESIRSFDSAHYRENVISFMELHGVREDGNASEKVAEFIREFMRR